MKFKKIAIFFIFGLSGCAIANEDYKVDNWFVSQDKKLNDVGTNIVNLKNSNDLSVVGVSETNGKLSAVSVFTDKGESAGIQFKRNENNIDYIKFSPWFSSGSFDKSYLKLYRNSKNNWVLTEYADSSEREVIRSVELK